MSREHVLVPVPFNLPTDAPRVLVTGASGFVGSHFVRALMERGARIKAFGRNTSTKNLMRLWDHTAKPLYPNCFEMVFGDLTEDISGLCESVDWVVNFAAKTFVDHSIRDPMPFLKSNLLGTANLLEEARRQGVKRFVQVSTDEVYGAILEGAYKEDARINPTNPYAASKAAADALAISYAHTYGMHTIVTRTENNYGPYQHPQKAMPVFVRKALEAKNLPVYGDGMHVRQWLYVEDHCSAIWHLLNHKDVPKGEVYHVAGCQELPNIELARKILQIVQPGVDPDKFIELVPDHNIRPGHDRRYALDCSKLRGLGWKPEWDLDLGLRHTVRWYMDNVWWFK